MAFEALSSKNEDLLRRDDAGAKDGFAIVDHLSRFSGLAVAQLYLICAAVTVYEIVARYVFHAPTSWAFEVAMSVCAVAWMISAGYVTLKKRHIGITVFYVMAGERGRWTLDLIAMVKQLGPPTFFITLSGKSQQRVLKSLSNPSRFQCHRTASLPITSTPMLAHFSG